MRPYHGVVVAISHRVKWMLSCYTYPRFRPKNMTTRTSFLTTAIALVSTFGLASLPQANAQVIYATPGLAYFENFSHPTLSSGSISSGKVLEWRDNDTFRGWFAAYYDGLKDVYDTPDLLMVSEGRSRPEIAFYLYRTLKAPSDGALGAQPSDQRSPGPRAGGTFYGVYITNATTATLTRLSLSYRVELYRLASAPNTRQTTLRVSWRIGGESLGEGTWKNIPDSDYTTPLESSGGDAGQNVDGNAEPHATTFALLTAPGLVLAPGQRLWLRWFDVNNGGVDHGIGLDDVSITLSP